MTQSSGAADPDDSADLGDSATSVGVTAARATTAFENLYRAEFPVMFRLATLLGAADPEGIAQEALVRLHSRWSSLADPKRAGGYVRTTVVNLCRSAARHDAVAARYEAVQAPLDRAPSAEAVALQEVSDRALLDALGALSRRHREALVLRFWLDLPESEMAEAMGCSTGSVKSHVSRGLSALRAALATTSESGGDLR
jgi:RNA polymerase sigma factor (sigma-70 family)